MDILYLMDASLIDCKSCPIRFCCLAARFGKESIDQREYCPLIILIKKAEITIPNSVVWLKDK